MSETDVCLREIILNIARMDTAVPSEELFSNLDCDLMSDFGFDSLLMVQLIVEVEAKFEMEFSLEDLDINVLRKYWELVKYVDENKG